MAPSVAGGPSPPVAMPGYAACASHSGDVRPGAVLAEDIEVR